MSSLNRPLAGDAMFFDLAEEIEHVQAAEPAAQTRRTARTLVKNGPLRVTLILMHAGGEIAEHTAPGPITVQVLRGSIRFRVEDNEQRIDAGQIISLGGGVLHSVAADEEAAFLLTLVQPQ